MISCRYSDVLSKTILNNKKILIFNALFSAYYKSEEYMLKTESAISIY